MKILLVDDDAGFRNSVVNALEMSGHHVYPAATYQDAIDTFAENDLLDDSSFQVAIVDWDLGIVSERDGPATVRALKALDPTMGVLLWSGLQREPVEEADRQLVKSDIDELFDWLSYEKGVHGGS